MKLILAICAALWVSFDGDYANAACYVNCDGFTSSTTPWGTTNYQFNDGTTAQSSTTPWGTTNYRDSNGNTMSCSTTPWGTTTCN